MQAAWETISVDHAARLAAQAAKEFDGGGVELIRSGANHVFASTTTVVRVGPASEIANAQVELAQQLLAAGFRVPKPLADPVVTSTLVVSVWERIVSSGEPIDYRQLGAVITRLHDTSPDTLSKAHSFPLFSEAAWLQINTNLDQVSEKGILNADDVAILRRACSGVFGWDSSISESDLVLCHGDVHPQNVLMSEGAVVLIDWDTACVGPREWDHAALVTWADRWGGETDAYENFAAGYGSDLRSGLTARRLADVRLLAPTINLALRAANDRRFASELERRMQYWRGETYPAVWTPQ